MLLVAHVSTQYTVVKYCVQLVCVLIPSGVDSLEEGLTTVYIASHLGSNLKERAALYLTLHSWFLNWK